MASWCHQRQGPMVAGPMPPSSVKSTTRMGAQHIHRVRLPLASAGSPCEKGCCRTAVSWVYPALHSTQQSPYPPCTPLSSRCLSAATSGSVQGAGFGVTSDAPASMPPFPMTRMLGCAGLRARVYQLPAIGIVAGRHEESSFIKMPTAGGVGTTRCTGILITAGSHRRSSTACTRHQDGITERVSVGMAADRTGTPSRGCRWRWSKAR